MPMHHVVDTTQHPPVTQRYTEAIPADVTPSALSTARALLRLQEGTHFAIITRRGGRLTVEPMQLIREKSIEIGE